MTRNYDYLPDDAEALKAEIERLDRRVTELEGERDAAVEAAVLAERQACKEIARDAARRWESPDLYFPNQPPLATFACENVAHLIGARP